MDQALRDKWVAALRSGDYEQAQGALRDLVGHSGFGDEEGQAVEEVMGYCCLGVLADVMGCDWNAEYAQLGSVERLKNYGLLPDAIRREIGLSVVQQAALSQLNDNGASFDYIADVIEKRLK